MTLSDIAHIRLQNQQLVRPRFSSPAELVRWFGAVQSQDLPASLWAVGMRLNKPCTEAHIEQAIANKLIVRTWPMRGTIHLVPAEDAKWMTRLLGPRLDAKVVSNFRRAELTEHEVTLAGEVIAATLRGRQCIRAEVYRALEDAGIATGGRNGEQRGMHLLVYWARHGLICVTPRRGKQQTFALLDEWLPGGRNLEGDEALAELAERYFQSHGPATIKDFAWWTGVTVAEAKRAVGRIEQLLQAATVDGTDYWFINNAQAQSAQAFLLPPFDEYTIAYADRSAVIDRNKLKSVGYGIAPNVVIDGRIAGTYKRTLQKQSVTIALQPLNPLSTEYDMLVKEAAKRYAAFLGLEANVA